MAIKSGQLRTSMAMQFGKKEAARSLSHLVLSVDWDSYFILFCNGSIDPDLCAGKLYACALKSRF